MKIPAESVVTFSDHCVRSRFFKQAENRATVDEKFDSDALSLHVLSIPRILSHLSISRRLCDQIYRHKRMWYE